MTDIPASITIRGPKLLLRPLTPREIDDEWRGMVQADPMSIVSLPSEAAFRDRLERSGRLEDGWLDLSIDLDGECIGRIQTFVPSEEPLPPGVFEIGIGLWAHARGRGSRAGGRRTAHRLAVRARGRGPGAGTDRPKERGHASGLRSRRMGARRDLS